MAGKPKNLKHGARIGVHLNKLIDDDFLDFMNTQSNLSGVALLGLLELYRKYGTVDLIDIVPQRFSLESGRPIPLEARQSRFQTDYAQPENYGEQSNGDMPKKNLQQAELHQPAVVYPTIQQHYVPNQTHMEQQHNYRPPQQMDINNMMPQKDGQYKQHSYTELSQPYNTSQDGQPYNNPGAELHDTSHLNKVQPPVQQLNQGLIHSHPAQQQEQLSVYNNDQPMTQNMSQGPIIKQSTYTQQIDPNTSSTINREEKNQFESGPSQYVEPEIASRGSEEEDGWNMSDFKNYSEADFYKK